MNILKSKLFWIGFVFLWVTEIISYLVKDWSAWKQNLLIASVIMLIFATRKIYNVFLGNRRFWIGYQVAWIFLLIYDFTLGKSSIAHTILIGVIVILCTALDGASLGKEKDVSR